MAERKHTPAPWAFDKSTGEIYAVDGDVCPRIATVDLDNTSPEQGEADGHLSAAGPEMLEALELHRAYEATPQDRGGENGPKGRARAKWIAARDAAIAKAHGEGG